MVWGFPKIRGTFLEGPNNKDYSILGSILGSPYFGKLPFLHEFGDQPVLCFIVSCVVFRFSLSR